jgi:hypothetical protein
MRINIGRNLQRRFRSLVAIEGDLFLLGRSQSRIALFSVLTCLIVISSIAQAASPAIDLKQAVDTFVQSIQAQDRAATRTLLPTLSQEPGW